MGPVHKNQTTSDLAGWPQLDTAHSCRSQQLDSDLLGGGAGFAGGSEQQRPGQPGDDLPGWDQLEQPQLGGRQRLDLPLLVAGAGAVGGGE